MLTIGLIALCIGSLFITIGGVLFDSRVVGIGQVRVEENLHRLNKLYRCKECNKLHRTHHRELKLLKVKAETGETKFANTCPHCLANVQLVEEKKEYEWMKTNPDCFLLTNKSLKIYLHGIKQVKEKLKEKEEIDSFMEYNQIRQKLQPPKEEPIKPKKKIIEFNGEFFHIAEGEPPTFWRISKGSHKGTWTRTSPEFWGWVEAFPELARESIQIAKIELKPGNREGVK